MPARSARVMPWGLGCIPWPSASPCGPGPSVPPSVTWKGGLPRCPELKRSTKPPGKISLRFSTRKSAACRKNTGLPLILSYLESKGRDRVAKELGWPEGTVARRLERGRELLRQQLIKRGIALSAGAFATILVDKVAAAPVPTLLAINTIKAATTVISGQAAGGGFLSAQALILAEETMKTMLIIKAKLVLLALTVSVAIGGAGWRRGYKALTETGQAAPVAKGQEKGKEVAEAKDVVATDLYGDPLPAGAVGRLGTVRFRFDGGHNDLAFTPDGKNVVATTNLGIYLWDSTTGKERYHLPFDTSKMRIGTIAFSPDGKFLAVAGNSLIIGKNPKVIFCELESGKIIRELLLPEENVPPPNKKGVQNGGGGGGGGMVGMDFIMKEIH